MCDISELGASDDVSFAHALVRELGVAVVPGSSFYSDPATGGQQVRFAFPKRITTLEAVAGRLLEVRSRRLGAEYAAG
jgi:aminotransferase